MFVRAPTSRLYFHANIAITNTSVPGSKQQHPFFKRRKFTQCMVRIFLFLACSLFSIFANAQSRPFKNLAGKWGLKNAAGQVIMQPRYDSITYFSEGYAAVKLNNQWGFINQYGVETVRPAYFSVQPFSEGLAVVFNGRMGYINTAGSVVIPLRYTVALSFSNGKARVYDANGWNYIDKTGKVVSTASPQRTDVAQSSAAPGGKFKLLYALERRGSQLSVTPAITAIRSNGILEQIVASANELFRLPYDIPVAFRKIGAKNAFYSPSQKRIDFGLELVEDLYTTLSQDYTGQELIDATTDAVVFILFHEMGHALIHTFDIPLSGDGEEAADNFAIYLFTNSNNHRLDLIALEGAQVFLRFSEKEKVVSATALADEHLLSKQRAFRILCKVYGKDPQRYGYLVTKNILPIDERRQAGCINEYNTMVRSWTRLLSPWTKKKQ